MLYLFCRRHFPRIASLFWRDALSIRAGLMIRNVYHCEQLKLWVKRLLLWRYWLLNFYTILFTIILMHLYTSLHLFIFSYFQCSIESTLHPGKQSVPLRYLSPAVNIPNVYSWAPVLQNFMVSKTINYQKIHDIFQKWINFCCAVVAIICDHINHIIVWSLL